MQSDLRQLALLPLAQGAIVPNQPAAGCPSGGLGDSCGVAEQKEAPCGAFGAALAAPIDQRKKSGSDFSTKAGPPASGAHVAPGGARATVAPYEAGLRSNLPVEMAELTGTRKSRLKSVSYVIEKVSGMIRSDPLFRTKTRT